MIRIGLILLMSIIISQIMLIIQVSLILSLLSVCADAVAELKLRGYNSLPGWGRAWIMILHAWPARPCYRATCAVAPKFLPLAFGSHGRPSAI